MASESFFFTAYAIALNGFPTRNHIRLLHLIPLVAIVSSALIFMGIAAAALAMQWLRGLLRERMTEAANLELPPLQMPGGVLPGLAAPLVLPFVFIAVWLYILAG